MKDMNGEELREFGKVVFGVVPNSTNTHMEVVEDNLSVSLRRYTCNGVSMLIRQSHVGGEETPFRVLRVENFNGLAQLEAEREERQKLQEEVDKFRASLG